MIDCTNHSYYDEFTPDYQKIDVCGKPIYIFAYHAIAIRAWHDIKSKTGKALSLITLDHHTDTCEPLRAYFGFFLRKDEKRLISLLDEIKENISDGLLKNLLQPGKYLKPTENPDSIASYDHLRLLNDEHISTSLFLDILDTAYICGHRSSTNGKYLEKDRLREVYQRIHYIPSPKLTDTEYDYIEKNKLPSITRDIFSMQKRSINNTCISYWKNNGLDTSQRYILDIDLDYFEDIGVLEESDDQYTKFAKLVENAEAITIATEPRFVDYANEKYNDCISDFNTECRVNMLLPQKEWNSHICLGKLLRIIEKSLFYQA